MSEAAKASDEAIFTARLTPHRSLGPRGFRNLMAATFLATTAMSVPFYLMGAWPIVGFLGLDVAAIYFAFKVNYRAARAYEDFRLSYFELKVARADPAGQKREWLFAPAFVRFERIDHEEFGLQRLSLISRGRRLDVARFLGPDEKAEFAGAFSKALAEAKRGRRFSE
jgi:uncharacterized membrane protein